jgi:hypothetical protein
MRNWRENNPERTKEAYRKQYWSDPKLAFIKTRKWFVKKNYGITYEEYLEMIQKQDGRCAICGDVMNPPCVDHNHKTGVVRGMLCSHCNFALGQVRENVQILKNMIAYLERWNGGELS